jgi:hypothetical protein
MNLKLWLKNLYRPIVLSASEQQSERDRLSAPTI